MIEIVLRALNGSHEETSLLFRWLYEPISGRASNAEAGEGREGRGGASSSEVSAIKFHIDSKASWRFKRKRGDNPIAAIPAPRTPAL